MWPGGGRQIWVWILPPTTECWAKCSIFLSLLDLNLTNNICLENCWGISREVSINFSFCIICDWNHSASKCYTSLLMDYTRLIITFREREQFDSIKILLIEKNGRWPWKLWETVADLWGDRDRSFAVQFMGHKMEHKKVALKNFDIVNIVIFTWKRKVRLC